MATVKVKRTRTVVENVSISYPDWFPDDRTPLGKAVDVLLEDQEYVKDTEGYRMQIYSDDADMVEQTIAKLDRLYKTAGRINLILKAGPKA